MGWWSNVVESYKYQKQLKEHQKYCKEQQAKLDKAVKDNSSNPLQADLVRNMLVQEQAAAFRPAPTKPENMSRLGRFFAGSAKLSEAEEKSYTATQSMFGNTAADQQRRNREHGHTAEQMAAATASGKVYAATVTEQGEIVPGAAQQVRSTPNATDPGMASKHHTLPYKEAQEVASNANGFLYVKKSLDELSGELRPTLPETLTIPDKSTKAKEGDTVTLPLREGYNRLIRGVARASFDSQGNVTEDAPYVMAKFTEVAHNFEVNATVEQREAAYKAAVETHLKPTMSAEGDIPVDQQVDMIAKCLAHAESIPRTIKRSGKEEVHTLSALVNDEGASTWKTSMQIIIGNQAHPVGDHLEIAKQELAQKHGEDSPAYQAALNKEGAIITDLYGQAAATKKAVQALRDLDVHGQEVPLINACSANSVMMENLTALAAPDKGLKRSIYVVENYWADEAHVREGLQHLKDAAASDPNPKEDRLKTLSDLESRLEHGDPAARKSIAKMVVVDTKYTYHEAGVVGITDTQGITIETFAAETCQLSVPPFTFDSAVGIYETSAADRDKQILSGMKQYYDMDKSLPDEATRDILQHSERLKSLLKEVGDTLTNPYSKPESADRQGVIDEIVQGDHAAACQRIAQTATPVAPTDASQKPAQKEGEQLDFATLSKTVKQSQETQYTATNRPREHKEAEKTQPVSQPKGPAMKQ